jgi:hypothetical protein
MSVFNRHCGVSRRRTTREKIEVAVPDETRCVLCVLFPDRKLLNLCTDISHPLEAVSAHRKGPTGVPYISCIALDFYEFDPE